MKKGKWIVRTTGAEAPVLFFRLYVAAEAATHKAKSTDEAWFVVAQ